ncbi:hypothetical protein [Kushneria avicenniae]|nr:hypothetical protein [Kushneria avicenniae]
MSLTAFFIGIFACSLVSFAMGCQSYLLAKKLRKKTNKASSIVFNFFKKTAFKPSNIITKERAFGLIIVSAFAFAIVTSAFYVISNNFTFGEMLNPLTDIEKWSTFGTLLSGLFTLVTAFSVIGTLLYLKKQDKAFKQNLAAQEKINKQQARTLNFEFFMHHKKMFFEMLENFENSRNKTFVLKDKEKLYKMAFPKNTFDHIETDIDLQNTELKEKPNLGYLIEKRKKWIPESELEPIEFDVNYYIRLHSLLGCEPKSTLKTGDVIFHGRNTGINAYDLSKSEHLFSSIINQILSFGRCETTSIITKLFNINSARVSIIQLHENTKRDVIYTQRT